MNKSDKIRETLENTLARRNNQKCKTVSIKIQRNHLSATGKQYINQLFNEAKWFYNTILDSKNVYNFDSKINKVNVFNRLTRNFDSQELEFLSSQMKQGIHDIIKNNKKSLDYHHIGRNLRFKSEINSVPLKQFGNTYYIKGHYFKLQNAPCKFKIHGLKQIKGEIANACLTRKGKEYYINVITFENNNNIVRTDKTKVSNFPIKLCATPKLKKFGQKIKYSSIIKDISSSPAVWATSLSSGSELSVGEPKPLTPKSAFIFSSVNEMIEDSGLSLFNAPINPNSCAMHDPNNDDEDEEEITSNSWSSLYRNAGGFENPKKFSSPSRNG